MIDPKLLLLLATGTLLLLNGLIAGRFAPRAEEREAAAPESQDRTSDVNATPASATERT